jgi:hypothetical protein
MLSFVGVNQARSQFSDDSLFQRDQGCRTPNWIHGAMPKTNVVVARRTRSDADESSAIGDHPGFQRSAGQSDDLNDATIRRSAKFRVETSGRGAGEIVRPRLCGGLR